MPEQDPPPEQGDMQEQREQVEEAFSQAQDRHLQEWLQLQSQVPSRLHHYTTMDGLTGIVNSGSLWATDVRFMNDSSELSYALHLTDAAIRSALEAGSKGHIFGHIFDKVAHQVDFASYFEYGVRPFVACFCEEEDLLSQWRGYGFGETGAALGLDFSRILQYGGMPPATVLRKVIYQPEIQLQQVTAVVETWLQTAEHLLNSVPGLADNASHFPAWATRALQMALLEHHLCFKNPAFEGEQEWRLIRLVNAREAAHLLGRRRSDERSARRAPPRVADPAEFMPTPDADSGTKRTNIHFRRSSIGLVPYVDLHLRDPAGNFTDALPLRQITQGPTSSPELASGSLKLFLEAHGYTSTGIRLSRIPLRW